MKDKRYSESVDMQDRRSKKTVSIQDERCTESAYNIDLEDRKRERRKELKRRRRRRQLRLRILMIALVGFLAGCGFVAVNQYLGRRSLRTMDQMDVTDSTRPELDVQLLTINSYSRPGYALNSIKGIVIHYTGNPGSTAQGNRDYFESLKDTHTTKASSHFVIGLDGEIIQCIPTAEISYASNNRNKDTISIEVCHPDESGVFNEATYESLVHLTAWLCNRSGLDEEDVIRHYDVTGKICPKYYVEHEDAWEQLKADVGIKMGELENVRAS